jgi:hypothetical protein
LFDGMAGGGGNLAPVPLDDDLNEYDRRILSGAVARFGKYLMERSYDVGMREAEWTLAGRWRSSGSRDLSEQLARLTDDERAAVMALVRGALVAALHGLLHGLSHDQEQIRLLFEEHDVAQESDGLHGDLFLFLRLLSSYPYDVREDPDGAASGSTFE